MRVLCLLFSEPVELEAFATACLRLSPQISLGDRALFIEIGKCRRLYSESSLLSRAKVLLQRFGHSARMAIADDIPTARAFCQFSSAQKERLPVEALPIFINPFQPPPNLQKSILALRKLGVFTTSKFLDLNGKSLLARFGKDFLLARDHLRSAQHLAWPAFRPKEIIHESFRIDEAYLIRDLPPILFLLKAALDKALLRLRGKGQLVSRLQIRIELENYSHVQQAQRTWVMDFAFPQGSVVSVLPMLRERIDRDLQKQPLEAPLRQVDIEILKAVNSGSRQRDFFSKKEEEEENFQSIVSQLIDRLGFAQVFLANPQATYVPERSWQKVHDPLQVQEMMIPLPPRPLRLLKQPQPLYRLEDFLLCQQKKWRILSWEGPERISGEWFFMDQERDYYIVSTHTQESLWIYQDPAANYFLHGIFD